MSLIKLHDIRNLQIIKSTEEETLLEEVYDK